jgi:hypothetical protein
MPRALTVLLFAAVSVFLIRAHYACYKTSLHARCEFGCGQTVMRGLSRQVPTRNCIAVRRKYSAYPCCGVSNDIAAVRCPFAHMPARSCRLESSSHYLAVTIPYSNTQ